MPDPANESFTILQIVTYIGSAVGGAIAAFLGVRAKQRRNGERDDHPNRNAARGVQWWWDGPVGKALEVLHDIYTVLTETRSDRQRIADEARADQQRFADERNRKMDDQIALLRDIEHNTRDIRSGRPTRRD